MPTFQGQISDEQLNALVAYVKSLGQAVDATGGKGNGRCDPATSEPRVTRMATAVLETGERETT